MCRNSTLLRVLAAALLGAASSQAYAQATPSVSTARTLILHPATVVKVEDLDFGSVVVTADGTIVLDPVTNAVSVTGGVVPVSGSPHAALFVGAASGGAVVNIKLPKQPVTLTRVSGTETLMLSNFTLDSPDKRTMARTESFEFRVGGTVNIPANPVDGTYVGTFTVSVQYP